MDEPTLPLSSYSSLPLISRLDQLEFIMKYLERKQRGVSNEYCSEKQCEALDLGVKDTYFKGSVLDRVASLEHRLLQLCVEMDSRSSSYPLSRASTQDSGESSSTQTNTEIFHSSFPTFNFNNLPTRLPHSHNFQVKVVEMKDGSDGKKEEGKNREKRKEKKSKEDAKKRAPPTWPHFKLLGC